jgi:hypothetical protein
VCGIFGSVNLGGGTVRDPARVLAMGELLGHRGPDRSGHLASPEAVLGARRLAIVELGGEADQPARVLMAGGGTLQREGSDRILLRPVADRLLAEPPPADIDVLGQTLPLGGEVLFATGDVWLGARPIWLSDNPGVLEVQPGDVAISRSNGTARLRLSFEDLSREWVVRVAQRPVELWGVAPADTTVTVGASFPLRVFGQDRNGFALVPGARVAWLVGGGILVDSLGVLTATQAGPAFASAVLGNTQHTAVLTIVPAGS